MDRPGVVEDEGNGGGEIEREGSLVDEGNSGEAESSGSGLGGDKRLSEVGVDKRGGGGWTQVRLCGRGSREG